MKIRPVLYLDTSIRRRLDDEANPDLRRATRRFMEMIGRRSRLKTSILVVAELDEVPFQTARSRGLRKLRAQRPRVVPTTSAVHRVADELLGMGCLGPDGLEDVYHIAYALVGGADFLVTWDRGDLARAGTRLIVRRWCKAHRRGELVIDTPRGVATWLDVSIP